LHKKVLKNKETKSMGIELKKAKKVLVQESLLTMPSGGSDLIKTKHIKAASIRTAIRELNRKGYSFESTERGLIDEVKVTRLK